MKRVVAKGFTIVELLVVIVVIAILASVTIVVYSGVQQKADNAARVAAAKDWYKIWQTYLTQNGQYPAATSNNHYCLGENLPTDLDTNPDEDCYMKTNIKHTAAAITTAMKTVSPTLPIFPPAKLAASTSPQVVGISMRSHDALVDQATGTVLQANYRMLHFWLQGNNQDCVLRPVAVAVSGGWAISSSATYTANDGAQTRCVVPLPDPAGV